MTKEELLTALRAAPGPSRELDAEIALLCGWKLDLSSKDDECWFDPIDRCFCSAEYIPLFTDSRDAAAAFRERMLPEWDYDSGKDDEGLYGRVYWDAYIDFVERCATECLSMCAAVVAGVIAKEGK